MSDDETATTKADAKADAKAEKARAKAMRPWYKKKRWIIPLIVVVLVFLIIATSGGGDGGGDADLAADDTSEDADAGSDDGGEGGGGSEPERAAVGEPAVDGQFTFTVTDQLDCGHDTIGEEGLEEDAQGQWCILTAEVENTGDEPRSLSASAQLLYDSEGREFQASSPMGADSPVYERINPGNSVEGDFFFDVPDDFEAAYAELHDSALSGGVQVELSE